MHCSRQSGWSVGLIVLLCGVAGCPSPKPCQTGSERPTSRGFDRRDFEQISDNGFDPEDNAADINAYAWSMEHFTPDGSDNGCIYVGSGNDMTTLVLENFDAILGFGELGEVDTHPTEIRRYCPAEAAPPWQRVLDMRDIDPAGEDDTIGFRYMRQYRAASDGVNYLYAATMSRAAKLFRSASGEPGTWEVVWELGDAGSVRMMEEHDGLLYLAISNETGLGEQIGRIWATDGDAFWPVIEDGFGNPDNLNVMSLISWNGWLYAGTQNLATGYEIWKMAGPEEESPVLVVARGGPDPVNESAISPHVFKGQLYMGAMIYFYNNFLRGLEAADIIRINPDDTWETVVGPDSLSGYDSGFNHWPNTYIWNMHSHNGWLYASTYDQVSAFPRYAEGFGLFLEKLFAQPIRLGRQATFVESIWSSGTDLYKSYDGVHWCPITIDGFGDAGNSGFRTMKSVGADFYLGTTNPYDGLEIWKATSPPE